MTYQSITIRVSPKTASQIRDRADKLKTSQSAVTRELLELVLLEKATPAIGDTSTVEARLNEISRQLSQVNLTTEEHYDLLKRLIEALAIYQTDGWAI